MAALAQLLIAIFEAIPAIRDLWVRLVSAIEAAETAKMKQENNDAIRKVQDEHDQRDAEKAIGNPHPGEPSNDPGAVIRDNPPRMP